METICIKCQICFPGKNKKNISVSSTEFAHKVVKINRFFVVVFSDFGHCLQAVKIEANAGFFISLF